jgi:hypothetical protein
MHPPNFPRQRLSRGLPFSRPRVVLPARKREQGDIELACKLAEDVERAIGWTAVRRVRKACAEEQDPRSHAAQSYNGLLFSAVISNSGAP